jgi:carbamoyltransferase
MGAEWWHRVSQPDHTIGDDYRAADWQETYGISGFGGLLRAALLEWRCRPVSVYADHRADGKHTAEVPLRSGYVLGIADMFHDSAACLVHAGRIAVAVEEERLSRQKHDEAFPARAVRYCLRAADLTMDDIDLVVRTARDMSAPPRPSTRPRTVYIRHHLAHAASAYFASGFDDAAIMVLDGGGSFGALAPILGHSDGRERQTFWRGRADEIVNVSTWASPENGDSPYPRSLGQMYELATDVLGFHPIFDAGKTMGLAAYGSGLMRRPLDRYYGMEDDGHLYSRMRDTAEWECFRRASGDPVASDHKELAGMAQRELEECVVRMGCHLQRSTGSTRLCMAGGVALNSVLNTRIRHECGFDDLFIQPASGDSGLAIGAALWGARMLGSTADAEPMRHAYLGRCYAEREIESALRGVAGLRVRALTGDAIIDETCRLLTDGRVVGWFHGGSEFGPRALGHRSILADPRRLEMRDYLNHQVKGREWFRPFAPAVPLEAAPEYFEIDGPSPFMLLVAPVRADRRSTIPAVTHVDGSARVQTLTAAENDRFYHLVRAFGLATGTPVLLNTSFNLAGEPIVETPRDALQTFLRSRIDYLVIENLLLARDGSP